MKASLFWTVRAVNSPRTPRISWRRLIWRQQTCAWGRCWRMRSSSSNNRSRKTRSHILSCFRTCRRTRVCFEKTLVNLSRSPFGREIRAHCVDLGDPRGSEHFKAKPRFSWRDEIDFAVSEGLERMEVAQRRSSQPQACNSVGNVVVSCVAVLVLTSSGMFSTWHRLCVLRPQA